MAIAALQPTLLPIEEDIETLFSEIAALPQQQTLNFHLTNAQIKSATAIQIIAAQGVGTIIQPLSLYQRLNYGGTSGFTGGATNSVVLGYTSVLAATPYFQFGPAGVASATQAEIGLSSVATTSKAAQSSYENLPLYVSWGAQVTGNAANDNTMDFILTYQILTL